MSNAFKATLPGMNGLASTVANPALPVALEDGNFVSAKTVRIIEIIRDTWPVLDVKWIPRSQRQENDPAFLIVEKSNDGVEYPVFFVKNEDEFNGEVIQRLVMSDSHRQDVHGVVEAQNEAIRMIQEKIKEDAREERIDMIRHAVKSGKYDYTVPGRDGKPIKLDAHGARILRGEV